MPRPLSELEILDFREKLAEAAEALVARLGLANFTIRELADELEVSPMTPYRYVEDKDEILAITRARAFRKFAEALEAAYAAPGTPAEKANETGRAYVRFALEDSTSYKLMFEVDQDDGKYPELAEAAARARQTLTRHIKPLIDAGLVQGDPNVVGHVYWAMLHGALMLKLSGKIDPDCTLDTILESAFAAFQIGYAPKT